MALRRDAAPSAHTDPPLLMLLAGLGAVTLTIALASAFALSAVRFGPWSPPPAAAPTVPSPTASDTPTKSPQPTSSPTWVGVGGYEQALRTSARAGHSEHQLGTAIDVTSEGGQAPWEYADWASTPAGTWMADNAWRYGFV
ncbi:MAG: D-alanyl-D-alanine carboxypeptidase family protein, partial [Chloroflexi bacterium]|nr:D-alanyl-D-alanine carboxypeptidase family protein [Chloroflexota bacterium]